MGRVLTRYAIPRTLGKKAKLTVKLWLQLHCLLTSSFSPQNTSHPAIQCSE